MGFFTNILAQKEYSMDDFTNDIRKRLNGGRTSSGQYVNEDRAMKFISVYSCVRVLAEGVGALPFFVYKKRPGGGKDKADTHPVFELLHDRPNSEMTSQSWREAQVGHLATSGNCYSATSLNRRGQVADIYPIAWNECTPIRNKVTGKIEYEIAGDGTYPAERIFHVPGFGFDGLFGYSPIRMAADAVGLGIASSEFTSHFYQNGMNVGGVLEHPQALSDVAYNRLQEWINEKGVGLGNSWKPLILEDGMKFSRIPMPFVDAQFIETRKLNRDEICGLFRVPPHMIANLERSTNNNIEHQGIEFVMHTLMPYLTRFEQTANWKLFTPAERAAGYYVKFNVDGLLRGDYKSRQEGLAIQRQNGTINADEWRELEDRNPIEDGSGQIYIVNTAAQPLQTAGQTPKEGGD
ncbi:phage portal protein [Paenibacillus rhizophilus]|uniref:Phage portal protein n=1 Tax=Paenibacillus rhizophilus TaxID=1850366 RepID=A0A3N9P942_9BACL|nr:phage portal protein [Paenibacillus rhizophilus]RQW11837.1 phage portal protein [Paenibacillus rhizophilus]